MRLNRGQLSTPIAVLRAQRTPKEMGGSNVEFRQVAQTWCEWLPVATSTIVQAQAEQIELTAKLHVDIDCKILTQDQIQNLEDNTVYDVMTVQSVPKDHKKIILCKAASYD